MRRNAMKTSKEAGKLILTTLTGVASGAIIGLLFAPDKGSETRRKISKKGDDYLKKIKKDIDEAREYLNNRVEETQDEIDEIKQEAVNAAEIARDGQESKAERLEDWTKEELYQRAKKEKIRGYSTMNKDELIEALKNN